MNEQTQANGTGTVWCPGCHSTHPEGVYHCPNCGFRFRPMVEFMSQVFQKMLGEGKMEIKTEDRDGVVDKKEESEWLHVGGRSVVG